MISDENDDGDSTFDDIPQQEDKKIGAKKLAKLQRKAEQKAMREVMIVLLFMLLKY